MMNFDTDVNLEKNDKNQENFEKKKKIIVISLSAAIVFITLIAGLLFAKKSKESSHENDGLSEVVDEENGDSKNEEEKNKEKKENEEIIVNRSEYFFEKKIGLVIANALSFIVIIVLLFLWENDKLPNILSVKKCECSQERFSSAIIGKIVHIKKTILTNKASYIIAGLGLFEKPNWFGIATLGALVVITFLVEFILNCFLIGSISHFLSKDKNKRYFHTLKMSFKKRIQYFSSLSKTKLFFFVLGYLLYAFIIIMMIAKLIKRCECCTDGIIKNHHANYCCCFCDSTSGMSSEHFNFQIISPEVAKTNNEELQIKKKEDHNQDEDLGDNNIISNKNNKNNFESPSQDRNINQQFNSFTYSNTENRNQKNNEEEKNIESIDQDNNLQNNYLLSNSNNASMKGNNNFVSNENMNSNDNDIIGNYQNPKENSIDRNENITIQNENNENQNNQNQIPSLSRENNNDDFTSLQIDKLNLHNDRNPDNLTNHKELMNNHQDPDDPNMLNLLQNNMENNLNSNFNLFGNESNQMLNQNVGQNNDYLNNSHNNADADLDIHGPKIGGGLDIHGPKINVNDNENNKNPINGNAISENNKNDQDSNNLIKLEDSKDNLIMSDLHSLNMSLSSDAEYNNQNRSFSNSLIRGKVKSFKRSNSYILPSKNNNNNPNDKSFLSNLNKNNSINSFTNSNYVNDGKNQSFMCINDDDNKINQNLINDITLQNNNIIKTPTIKSKKIYQKPILKNTFLPNFSYKNNNINIADNKNDQVSKKENEKKIIDFDDFDDSSFISNINNNYNNSFLRKEIKFENENKNNISMRSPILNSKILEREKIKDLHKYKIPKSDIKGKNLNYSEIENPKLNSIIHEFKKLMDNPYNAEYKDKQSSDLCFNDIKERFGDNFDYFKGLRENNSRHDVKFNKNKLIPINPIKKKPTNKFEQKNKHRQIRPDDFSNRHGQISLIDYNQSYDQHGGYGSNRQIRPDDFSNRYGQISSIDYNQSYDQHGGCGLDDDFRNIHIIDDFNSNKKNKYKKYEKINNSDSRSPIEYENKKRNNIKRNTFNSIIPGFNFNILKSFDRDREKNKNSNNISSLTQYDNTIINNNKRKENLFLNFLKKKIKK